MLHCLSPMASVFIMRSIIYCKRQYDYRSRCSAHHDSAAIKLVKERMCHCVILQLRCDKATILTCDSSSQFRARCFATSLLAESRRTSSVVDRRRDSIFQLCICTLTAACMQAACRRRAAAIRWNYTTVEIASQRSMALSDFDAVQSIERRAVVRDTVFCNSCAVYAAFAALSPISHPHLLFTC